MPSATADADSLLRREQSRLPSVHRWRSSAPSPAAPAARTVTETSALRGVLAHRRRREHLHAVCAFPRLLACVADEAGADRAARLDCVSRELDVVFSGGESADPVLRGVGRAVRECRLPAPPLRQLVEVQQRDQVETRFETFADLLVHSRRASAPVGELALHVFGVATPERVKLSASLWGGLEIVSHLQDVGGDYARGRIYLPLEDMRLVGCREGDLTGSCAGPALRALLALEVERARGLLAEGAPLVPGLPVPARVVVARLLAGSRAVLDGLERDDYNVLGCCQRPGRRELAVAFGLAWWGRLQ